MKVASQLLLNGCVAHLDLQRSSFPLSSQQSVHLLQRSAGMELCHSQNRFC